MLRVAKAMPNKWELAGHARGECQPCRESMSGMPGEHVRHVIEVCYSSRRDYVKYVSLESAFVRKTNVLPFITFS